MEHRWAGAFSSCSVISQTQVFPGHGTGCDSSLMHYPLWALVGGKLLKDLPLASGAVFRFRGWLVRRLCYFLWSLEQHIPPCWDASQKVLESTG